MNFHTWKGYSISDYTLGTVQLGQEYGVANIAVRPSRALAGEILAIAGEAGINCFDTAQHYGDSEAILGDHFSSAQGPYPHIVTKLNPALDPGRPGAIADAVRGSLDRLRAKKLWCLMIHNVEWLRLWDTGAFRDLIDLKARGAIAHLGASVYTAEQAEAALLNPDIEVVQVPCNAWDQSMRARGIFDLAREKGKLCFIRSIYLQGLLTLPPDKVGQSLPAARAASERWIGLAREAGMDALELASRFALSLGFPVVIGAETPAQVRRNRELLDMPALDPAQAEAIAAEMGALVSEDILNPAKWARK